MKLLDLLEGYYDEPDYGDSVDRFIDEDLEDVKPIFTFVAWDQYGRTNKDASGIVVVRHNESKINYILHQDQVEDEFYIDSFYAVRDEDEDGPYTSWESSGDHRLEPSSFEVYATVMFENDEVGKNFTDFEDGFIIPFNYKTYKDIYNNDTELYNSVVKIISDQHRIQRR